MDDKRNLHSTHSEKDAYIFAGGYEFVPQMKLNTGIDVREIAVRVLVHAEGAIQIERVSCAARRRRQDSRADRLQHI